MRSTAFLAMPARGGSVTTTAGRSKGRVAGVRSD